MAFFERCISFAGGVDVTTCAGRTGATERPDDPACPIISMLPKLKIISQVIENKKNQLEIDPGRKTIVEKY